METKFDFTKSWTELSNEEQTSWDQKCQRSQIRKIKSFAKRMNIDFTGCSDLCVIDSVSEWNEKHIKTLRNNCVAKYKPLLKSATTLEEYNRLYKESAIELEAIGF